MKNLQLCEAIDKGIKSFVPEWRVVAIAESKLHSFIAKIVSPFFDYMRNSWTTFGYTAAHPHGASQEWLSRPHEGLHALQAKRWSRPLFLFLYLFPQSLFPLFILLSFLSPWWLLGLLCLAPIPAPFRAYWELKGYELDVLILTWIKNDTVDQYIEYFVNDVFSGSTYYFMAPFKSMIRERLLAAKRVAENWHNEEYSDHLRTPYISSIYKILVNNKAIL